jgi:3-deoxy-D-manno-octulosonic-acid transferase
VAFVGGSLLPYGGQNFIEACALGVPVLLGPHTYNFAKAGEDAVAAGAALTVADAEALVSRVKALLSERESRAAMAAAGRRFSAAHQGATGRLMGIVARLLAQ